MKTKKKVAARGTVRDQILNWLENRIDGYPRFIAVGIGVPTRTVSGILNRLRKDGRVTRARGLSGWLYSLPAPSASSEVA